MTIPDMITKLQTAAALRGATVTVEQRAHVHNADGTETVYSLAEPDTCAVVARLDATGKALTVTSDSAVAAMGPELTALPADVTGLVATPGDGKLTLAWTAVSGVDHYQVTAGATVFNPTTTSLVLTGLTNGTSVAIAVVAVTATGLMSLHTTITSATPAAPLVKPLAPASLTAVAGNHAVTLTWSASDTATAYYVYRKTTGAYTAWATPAGLTFVDTAALNGTTYTYVVTALNSKGESTGLSPEATATPVVPATVPSVPSGLVATAGTGQAILTWAPTAGATGYVVKRAGVTVGSPTAATFTDVGLFNGTAASYTVAASNAAGTSVDSSSVSTTPLAAPTGLAATPGNGQVVLTWTAVPGATGYTVKAGAAAPVVASTATYTATGLTNGTATTFLVGATATNAAGATASVVSTPVPPVTLTAPTAFTVTPSDGRVTLAWHAVASATGYRLKIGNATTVFGSYDVGPTVLTNFFDSTNGTQAFFSVCALNGTTEGPTTTVLACTASAPVTTPTTPVGLTATAGDGRVTLAWTATAGAVTYTVKRKTTGAFATIATPVTNTFVDLTAANGTAYTYAVSATNTAGTSADSATAPATPAAGIPSTRMKVGTNRWQEDWHPTTFTFVAGANFATATNPFNPALISDLAQYNGPIRSMDMVATLNNSGTSWTTRTAKTANLAAQTSDNGMAWEWFIALCNLTGRDAWVNVPTFTQVGRNANAYAVALATLLHDTLDPSLKIYVEYSNETWNGGPDGGPGNNPAGYCIAQGTNLNLPGGNGYEKGFAYHATASACVFNAFESVFGANSPRLVKVLAGRRGDGWLTGLHITRLAAEGQSANAYAWAPYYGAGITNLAGQAADLDAMLDEFQAGVLVAQAAGLMPICYEGGFELFQSGAATTGRDPAQYTNFTHMLTRLDAMGVKVYVNYLHDSPNTGNEAWGAVNAPGESPTTAHRWRAMLDWMAGS